MNFTEQYKIHKSTKYDIPKIIKNNKNIFFGSGGSSNIIILHKNTAIKIIPTFTTSKNQKYPRNNDIKEIEFYKFFTKEFLLKNITPHFVGYYSNYKLIDISKIFPKKCILISEKLFMDPKKINTIEDKLCKLKYEHKFGEIKPTADIVILEKCDHTIEQSINNIIKKHDYIDELKYFINRTIFQFIYSMACLQKLYPKFIHNDLFLRNVLGTIEDKYTNDDYVEYIFNNKSYYLPANGFYLKINDFGFSLNPPYIISTLLEDVKSWPISINMAYDDPKRDIFTFLYDFYDGANHGANSMMTLLKKKSDTTRKIIRKEFKKYIDVTTIDKIQKKNKILLNHQWNIKHIDVLQNCVKYADEYFDDNIFDKFAKKPNNKIIKTFSIQ
jgi:hypothetical protein